MLKFSLKAIPHTFTIGTTAKYDCCHHYSWLDYFYRSTTALTTRYFSQ